MDTSMNDLVKETARQQLTEASERLKNLCRLDANRPADQRVADLTHVYAEGGRFIAVFGSAHMMGDLFKAFLRERPEFRIVLQDALDDIYRVVEAPEY